MRLRSARLEFSGRHLEVGSRARVPQAGFTVLELIISFAILLIAMMIAGRLLLEAQARMSHSARQALEPVAAIALKQIRADIRSSTEVPAYGSAWNWEPLILLGHPNGTVSYKKLGDDLVRIVSRGSVTEPASRIILRSVSVWRWRLNPEAPLPLVDIELGQREIPRFALLAAAGQREAPIPVTRSHLMAVSPRQARRTGW